MKTLFFAIRCILFLALGVALSIAGIQVFSNVGAVVWGILLLISIFDGLNAINTYHEGHSAGIRFAIQTMLKISRNK